MNLKHKIICIFILFLLLVPYIFPLTSFSKYDTYTNYVALGDSTSQGYTIIDGVLVDDCYPQKLKEKCNISEENFANMSIPSLTTLQFYDLIQTSEYTEAIKNCDLLTITIGANEITQIGAEALSYATGVPMTWDPTFTDLVLEAFLEADLPTKTAMITAFHEYVTTQDIFGKVEANILQYKEYWSKSIDYIKQINPDVTIVATEFYNPYSGITLLTFDLGSLSDEVIQKLNGVLYECSDSETNYKIAKIYSTFNSTNPRLTYVNTSLTAFNPDPHPTVLGHEVISLKILEALYPANTSQRATDISLLSTNDIQDQEYTGEPIEPDIIIKDGDYTLEKEKDFSVIYYNNTNVGEGSAIVIGTGDYTGKVTKTFNIKNSNIKDISTCQIDSIETQVYLGMKLEPDIVISDGTKLLTRGTDYKLSYSNNLNAGMATITITGIGNYVGTTSTNFLIMPNLISLATVHDIPDQLYTGNEITPNVIASFGSSILIEGTDYTVSYENNVNTGVGTATITGKGNFTGTVTKEFNILNMVTSELKDISKASIAEISNRVYTGTFIAPLTRVIYEGEELEMYTDYKAYYNNNINVGTGLVTIVGIGDYTGIIETEFRITPRNVDGLEINNIPDQEYTGKNITPEITLLDSATVLTKNKDYMIKYINNIEIGVAAVQVEGIGNYTGSLTQTFNIIEPVVEADPEPPVQEQPKEETPPKPSDTTTSDKNLPYAGSTLILIISILVLCGTSCISYKLYRKYKF